MSQKTHALLLLPGLVWTLAAAGSPAPAPPERTSIETHVGGTNLRVEVVAEGILRVVATPAGKAPVAPPSWSVLPQMQSSTGKTRRGVGSWELATKGLRVKLEEGSGTLTFRDNRGRLLCEDRARTFEASHIQTTFRLPKGAPLFGLGQQEDGILDRRGQKVRLLQSNKRVAIPFLASPGTSQERAAWGLLWDNASHTEFEDGPDGMKLWSDVGEAVVYYVLAAPNLDGVLGRLRTLTGEVPLLPKWAYGLWQSKERYETQAELVGIAEEFRRRKLPLDVVVQDWRYWGRHGWNAMRFDDAIFPDPKGMVDRLHALNTKVLISIWPNMETSTAVAKDLAAQGALFTPAGTTDEGGTLGVYDAFSEKGRQTYWKHLQQGILSTGVDGLWKDATEPEFRSWTDDSLGQKSYVSEVPPTAAGPWLAHLNAYPLVDVEGLVRNWRAADPDVRPVILTRSAFLGQGRTGSVLWSGDIPSSFASLKRQLANGLNASMSGLPYWNTDIGGFFPAWFGGEYPKGVKDPAYRELYVRWFQVGAFHPLFRAHGTTTPREVWRFGEPGSAEYDAQVRMLKLRYRLLPYLYATGAELRHGAGSILRPLGMDFPDATAVQDQFLCGRSLMVSPVLEHQKVLEARQGAILDSATVTDPEGRPGLRASFFMGQELSGTPVQVIHVPRAEFNWNLKPPVGETGGTFSFRLEGSLKPQTAPQVFTLGGMGAFRAWVDGRSVVEDSRRGSFRLHRVPLDLAQGAALRIDFTGGDSSHLVAGLEAASTANAPRSGREVVLPKGGWVDFWTGEALQGAPRVWKEADLTTVPLHVRAGSILPLGPVRQYAQEKAEDPLELRIYAGADGHFDLYKDDGLTRAYERGAFTHIPFHWDDREHVLRIGPRQGAFLGMLTRRTLRIVRVRPGHGVGAGVTEAADWVVPYTGKALVVPLPLEPDRGSLDESAQ